MCSGKKIAMEGVIVIHVSLVIRLLYVKSVQIIPSTNSVRSFINL